jgi:6-phosphofructokinase 1
LEGRVNGVATLQHNSERGFHVSGVNGNDFRDRWGVIHARRVHSSFYDPERLGLSRVGVDYLLPIFNQALGADDLEHIRQSLFHRSNLTSPYHSVNVDINKRIGYLE